MVNNTLNSGFNKMTPIFHLKRGTNHTVRILVITMLVVGIWATCQGAYIFAKASVAQYLIRSSWQQSLLERTDVKPWPWADTWPVARLMVPKLGVDVYVLAGDSGRTLAFGPGYRFGTSFPGDNGNSIVSAHRDTHFKFLQYLVVGDVLVLQNKKGRVKEFHVADIKVVEVDNLLIPIQYDEAVLTLVTCYPFEALLPGSNKRYIVTLVENPQRPQIIT